MSATSGGGVETRTLPEGGEPPDGFLESLPKEKSAVLFRLSAIAGNGALHLPGFGGFLRSLGQLSTYVVSFLTPIVPFDLRRSVSFSRGPSFYVSVYLSTVFFCLVMTSAFSCVSGTFVPSGISLFGWQVCTVDTAPRLTGSVYFYSRDWYNWLVFYLFVCPTYVTCGVAIIACTMRYWKNLKLAADRANSLPVGDTAFLHRERASHRLRLSIFFVLVLASLSFLMANYMKDLIDPSTTKGTVYWFLTEVHGVRILNQAGVYYLLLNSGLLLVTMLAALSYFSLSFQIIRIASSFGKSNLAGTLENGKPIPNVYNEYFYCYAAAKVLILAYAINMVVWNASPAGATSNTYIAVAILFFMGFILVPLPRLYLEYKAHQFSGFKKDAYREYISHRYHLLSVFTNTLFVFLLLYSIRQKIQDSDLGIFIDFLVSVFG